MFRAAFNSKAALRAKRLCRLSWIAVLLAASNGCSLLETCGCISPPPPPPVNAMLAFCYEQVQFVADKANGERPLPGLVAKVWLSSGDSIKSTMVEANGVIHAEMYDMTPGVQPHQVAEWTFDKDTLKSTKQTDKIGMGYTLFLPWDTYSPQIKRVQVTLMYGEPGKPWRSGEPQIITLKNSDSPPPLVQQINVPNAPIGAAGMQMTPAPMIHQIDPTLGGAGVRMTPQ